MTIRVLRDKQIVLGVTGSIAAYKAVALASALHQAGAIVDVVMTPAAAELVRPLSFQAITHRPVALDMFHLLAETEIGHVTLAKRADLVLIAPATANTIAKLAHGLADDLVSTTVVATDAPIVLAPAMDAGMYEHAAVRQNLETLKARGVIVVEPGFGHLASGLVGTGRLADLDEIVGNVRWALGRGGDLAGWRVVVTAGGTQEPIDPVRVLTNRSSGKMGYALAEAARDRGAEVTLIAAPTALPDPVRVQTVHVRTAAEMSDAVLTACADADLLLMAAAVADYRPEAAAPEKIKKSGAALELRLVPTVDILAETARFGRPAGRLLRVGFAAESERLVEHARAKLEKKGLDLIVANDVTAPGSGFGVDTNKVTIVHREFERDLPLMPKTEVAEAILDEVRKLRTER